MKVTSFSAALWLAMWVGRSTASESSEVEWAGTFETGNPCYHWIAQKVDGEYADPTMKLVALPTEDASKETLEGSEELGESLMEGDNCTVVFQGDEIIPSKETCYLLTFDESTWETMFFVDASLTDAIAFFAQHVPTEFESDRHYFKECITGEDIEPVSEESGGHGGEKDKNWGPTIGAAIIVNVVTLVGIIFLIPGISQLMKKANPTHVYAGFAAFAAGAIIASAFFLLLFEATHLISSGWEEESEQIWRWGVMILAGLLMPGVVETFVGSFVPDAPAPAAEAPKTEEPQKEGAPETTSKEVTEFASKTFHQKIRLIFSVCFGDFMHNLADGFFIGAAFTGCSSSMAWGITLSTVLHEIPQELADFLILTGPQVGLSNTKALVLNFATGMSVILGAVIVLLTDIEESTIGLILAFGGGVYLNVGCVECMPKMVNPILPTRQKLICSLAFIFGAGLIGLVLLDHEHCGGDGHGHGHGH